MHMATRTTNQVVLSEQELTRVLDALNEAARENFKFANNKRNQPATRAYAERKANEYKDTADALLSRMFTWA
jgi:hypothetical protein